MFAKGRDLEVFDISRLRYNEVDQINYSLQDTVDVSELLWTIFFEFDH